MEENASSDRDRRLVRWSSDTIAAWLLAGLIVVWILAYAFFAIRAWMG